MKKYEIKNLARFFQDENNPLAIKVGCAIFESLPLGDRTDFINSNDFCNLVYELLKNREIHPSGEFDKQGRFYAHNRHLLNVRPPSGKWPFSEMVAARRMKYVKAVRDENFKLLITKVIYYF